MTSRRQHVIRLGDGRTGPRPRIRRSRLRRGAVLLAASLILSANMPASGLEGFGRKLDNSELSDMRGKFVSPDRVSYFGIALQSSWQTNDGVTTVATLMLNLNFAGPLGGTPQVMIGWSRACDGCSDPGLDVPAGADAVVPEGLNSVNGIVQTHLISGTDNSVRNVMTVTVLPAGQAPPSGGGAGLTPITTSTGQQFADGDKVQFIYEPGQVGLAMTQNGGELVRQSVGGELNQAAQHVILNSSLNAVTNSMGITVGLSDIAQADRLQIQNSLSAMKGHGF